MLEQKTYQYLIILQNYVVKSYATMNQLLSLINTDFYAILTMTSTSPTTGGRTVTEVTTELSILTKMTMLTVLIYMTSQLGTL